MLTIWIYLIILYHTSDLLFIIVEWSVSTKINVQFLKKKAPQRNKYLDQSEVDLTLGNQWEAKPGKQLVQLACFIHANPLAAIFNYS